MGRATVALGAPSLGAGVVDRLAGGLLFQNEGPRGDSSFSTPRAGAVLPALAECAEVGAREHQSGAETEVIPQLWLQLSLPERERFGHCFSFLVLKALGLRACSAQEVEA